MVDADPESLYPQLSGSASTTLIGADSQMEEGEHLKTSHQNTVSRRGFQDWNQSRKLIPFLKAEKQGFQELYRPLL